MSLNVVLVAPEIPQNTGNIGRLCVNFGFSLHLIKPLGFSLEEKMLQRAGLDYWQELDKFVYEDWDSFLNEAKPGRLFFSTTKTSRSYYDFEFKDGDYLCFGNESRGLPEAFYDRYAEQLYTIPMTGEHHRSFNLANAVAMVLGEAQRQITRK